MGKRRASADVQERPWTDLGNAEMFAELYHDDARFNHKTRDWIVWDGTRWKADANGHIMTMAKTVPRLRYRMASEIEDDTQRKNALEFARSCESLARLRNLIELAKTEKPLSDDGMGWDRDPYLLGVANGVLDLRTAELLQDRREDRVTLHSGVAYSETGCPRWEQFMHEIFNKDEELIAYVQRAIGYTLTGNFNEQYFHILFGEGQNGKSVFMNVLTNILGPYRIHCAVFYVRENFTVWNTHGPSSYGRETSRHCRGGR